MNFVVIWCVKEGQNDEMSSITWGRESSLSECISNKG